MPVPTKAEFQKSTSLAVAFGDRRGSDMILNWIDAMLDSFHAENQEPARAVRLAKIYYAAESWLKKADRGEGGVNGRRKPAVLNFYVTVVHELSKLTEVPINLLPNWLAETFGKAMEQHGADLDITKGYADYLTDVDVRKFRLSFRGGKAYQQKWWTDKDTWVKASSANVVDGTAAVRKQLGGSEVDVIAPGFSGYALSQGGDFYTGPHFAPNGSNSARYHSSYFGGDPVLGAGEIKIEDGQVVEINASSGHYCPDPRHMRTAVETLAMQGVKLSTLWVTAHGKPRMLALEYLKLEDLSFNPVDTRGLGVARQGYGTNSGGRTPASYARVAVTMKAHNSVGERNASFQKNAKDRQAAFQLFDMHWKSKADGGHGPGGRFKCKLCDAHKGQYDEYIKHVNAKAA